MQIAKVTLTPVAPLTAAQASAYAAAHPARAAFYAACAAIAQGTATHTQAQLAAAWLRNNSQR